MDAICIILKKNTEFADKMQIEKKKKKSQGWIDNWAKGLLKCRSDQTKTLNTTLPVQSRPFKLDAPGLINVRCTEFINYSVLYLTRLQL